MKQTLLCIYKKFDNYSKELSKKEIRINVDLMIGIVFLIFALFTMFIIPTQISISEKDLINGRVFPTLLSFIMLFCSIIIISKELYKKLRKKEINYKFINLWVEIKALTIFLILIVFYLLCRFTNSFVIGAIFCSLAFLVYFRCTKISYYITTLSISVFIWLLFKFVLGVNF